MLFMWNKLVKLIEFYKELFQKANLTSTSFLSSVPDYLREWLL